MIREDFRITLLKIKLRDTDYLAIKRSEGLMTEEEYAPIKAQRQAWRDEINAIQAENASKAKGE